ncbi:MAG: hypothetical protein ACI9EP_001752 [Oceanospirillaceae bacterium]|jgi:hypothetical protein
MAHSMHELPAPNPTRIISVTIRELNIANVDRLLEKLVTQYPERRNISRSSLINDMITEFFKGIEND